MLNNTARPMDFLYSRLATLSALQSYAATAGYYMSNHQHPIPTPSIPPLPSSNESTPRHLERLQSVSTQRLGFKRCKFNCHSNTTINLHNYTSQYLMLTGIEQIHRMHRSFTDGCSGIKVLISASKSSKQSDLIPK